MSESSLREIYVSTDIETDGPVAGKHSHVEHWIGSRSGRYSRRLCLRPRHLVHRRALPEEQHRLAPTDPVRVKAL